MGYAKGLSIYFSDSRGKFLYPMGDKDCVNAIGRFTKKGSEDTEIRFGYITRVTNNHVVGKDSGSWEVVRIKRVDFSEEQPDEIRLMILNVRKAKSQGLMERVELTTQKLFVDDLFG